MIVHVAAVMFFFFFFDRRRLSRRMLMHFFYRAEWVTHVTLSSTNHKDPQKHHQVVLNASMQQGVGVTSDIFPLLALLNMCFDVFPRQNVRAYSPTHLWVTARIYVYVNSSVLLLFFFTLEASFFPQILSFERFLFYCF